MTIYLLRKLPRRDQNQRPRSLVVLMFRIQSLRNPMSTRGIRRSWVWNIPTLLALRIFWTTGMQYAAVFPLPVLARARMSRLSSPRGMALACTSVGRAKPKSARALSMRESSICEKDANVAFLSTRRGSAMVVQAQAKSSNLQAKGSLKKCVT